MLQSSCGKKESDTTLDTSHETTTAAVSIATAEPDPNAVPTVFRDAALQSRFAELYGYYKTVFAPPSPGVSFRAFYTTGRRVDGPMVRFDSDGIMISTLDNAVVIHRKDLNDETLGRVYSDVFSRTMAKRHVELEIELGREAELNDLFFRTDLVATSVVRRFTAERASARFGPGRQFGIITNAELFRGQSVHVLHETNDWICVKDRRDAARPLGWIPKFFSFIPNPESKSAIAREVELLYDSGLLVEVTPAKNEVLVDAYEWSILDNAAMEGVCRLLAIYCGQQKNSRLHWVDVKNALDRTPLAEFSASKGLKLLHGVMH